MTKFPENLAILRKRAGYTQEALAEALGVSRQAVGKWESGQGLPEAATLLDLSDLLGCTLDQLMREDLDSSALEVPDRVEDAPEPGPRSVPLPSWAEFSAHMDRFARAIALGVCVILLGLALTVAATGLVGEENPAAALPILVFVAGAVFLFISAGLDHESFQRTWPQPPACPDPAERADFDARFRAGVALSVTGILGDVILLVVASLFFDEESRTMVFAAAVFLALLGLCVGTLVHLGILRGKYDPAPVPTPQERNVDGAIMLTATAIYLLLGFLWNLWHPGWVVFPIGGILCGILHALKGNS